MAALHRLEYSKSVRAKCHGPICKGASMDPGCLRYGRITRDGITGSEVVQWRHWGCVTPDILAELVAVFEDIPGFKQLKSVDQHKIRVALALRRVNPADVPSNSSSATISVNTNRDNPRKRKEPSAGSHLTASQARDEDNSLQNEAMEDEIPEELIVSMSSTVVGIQYYRGLVGTGEEVVLTREPTNQYDRNAIRVDNIGHVQVGHIPRTVASKLAPLMDSRAVSVEGIIQSGNLTGSRGYTLDITLKIYGPSDKVSQLQPRLVWATPGQRGFPQPRSTVPGDKNRVSTSSAPPLASVPKARASTQTPAQLEQIKKQLEARQKAAELRDMVSTLEKVNDEGRRSSLLDSICANEDILALPQYDTSQLRGLKVSLLKHQKQALQWALAHEYPRLPKKEDDKPVQFWQFKKNGNKSFYYNLATKTPKELEAPPPLGRGALLADAMGLGKTLTMLCLMLATKADVPKGFSNATLVVVPLSVLSNWEKQIYDHCEENTLTYCSYYGTTRAQLSAQELAKHDVVFTTYQTVAGEHENPKEQSVRKKKKTDKPLFEVKWKRIILDEGHSIRNPKTKMTQAVCALDGERRWVITGTPIVNSPRDLGSLMHFLRICRPIDDEEFFKRLVLRPLKAGDPSGVELLRALMSHVCLRRTKEMQDSAGNPLIPLPPVEMIKVPVALSDEARTLYDEVQRLSSERFQTLMTESNNAVMQSNALSMLTRLRQLALSPSLLPRDYIQQLKANATGGTNKIVVTKELKQQLQTRLAQAIEEAEECPICFSEPTEPKITNCGHIFCAPCIQEIISRNSLCPMDRRPLSLDDLYDPLPSTDLTQPAFLSQADEMEEAMRSSPSAKIEQLVHLLTLTPSGEKSLVFSQFTSFLDKIGEALSERGIPFIRFDGQMSAKRRQEAIARFSVPLAITPRAETLEEAPGPRRASRKSNDIDATDFVVSDNDHSEDEDFTTTRKNGKGKAKQTQADSDFEDDDSFGATQGLNNPAVMLISLKAGSLGLNLTVANNVYLMDPWWQEGIESQAIDRVNRIGQTKPVHVYQMISENTVESKVLEIQDKKKKLIQEAFSGVKRTENPRQMREARVNDLIELFGIRQLEATQRAAL